MTLGKILSWVGNRRVTDLSFDVKPDLASLKNILGSAVYVKDSKEKQIGKVSDIIGSVNSPKIVITLLPNVPENFDKKKIFIKNE